MIASKKNLSLIISNLIKDKLNLMNELKTKDIIINDLSNKINKYERSLSCHNR